MPYSPDFLDAIPVGHLAGMAEFSEQLDISVEESRLNGLLTAQVADFLKENFLRDLDFTAHKAVKNPAFSCAELLHEVVATDGRRVCTVVELYKATELSALPSDGQKLLVAYIATYGDFSIPFLSDVVSSKPFCFDEVDTIILWESADQDERKFVTSLYINEESAPNPVFNSYHAHTRLQLSANGFYKKLEEMSLLKQALNEARLKWRFLLFYRIFENGYLRNVLEDMQREFFNKPGDSIKKASDAVQNEFSLFRNLVEKNGLETQFSRIFNIANQAPNGSYLQILFKKSNSDARCKSGKPWMKGVFICYQVRCSIVHAGENSVYFDKYTDSPQGLAAIYPQFDEAVFKYLGAGFS